MLARNRKTRPQRSQIRLLAGLGRQVRGAALTYYNILRILHKYTIIEYIIRY